MQCMWWLALLLVQDARSQADRVRTAMAASIEKQRVSVRQQVQMTAATLPPWTMPEMPSPACEPIRNPELAQMIDDAAQHQGVDPAVVREVARQESGFHPCAVSPKGAEGLMQLMPTTQFGLQVRNPFDAKESLEAGSKLLKTLLDRYKGDLPLALSAYNAGPGSVDRAGGIPEIPETKNYVTEILNRLLH
jgi:soluble lytic murein transglycosylase-like protein